MYTTNKCYSLLVFYKTFIVPPYEGKRSDILQLDLKFHTRWVKQEMFPLKNREHISTWTVTVDTRRDHVSTWFWLFTLYCG